MSNYKPDMSREEIDICFERLNLVLRIVDLPTETQGLRSGVSAAEFMFMNYTYAGHIRFKHIDTRNYLILNPDDTLWIPLGGPFFKGFFDKVRP
ncbi:hypothetical protein LCGC14_0460860 [marine sediment metagenome]|uniref:Uncharacterized protein n=1 Tax=marine sediment metagenome TaxID=412755 RepID=A0A0F9SK78_9ZZZZ|nr:hypothetical protein [bacterium]